MTYLNPKIITYCADNYYTNCACLLSVTASATIGFSQATYTAIEGVDPILTICLVVVSLTGQPTDTVLVGFSDVMGGYNFTGAQVGDEILCQTVNISDDNVVERRVDVRIFAFIEALPFSMITFASGRDTTILSIVDDDCKFLTMINY